MGNVSSVSKLDSFVFDTTAPTGLNFNVNKQYISTVNAGSLQNLTANDATSGLYQIKVEGAGLKTPIV